MAFRIGSSAIKGEIDNRLRDHVMGCVWVEGCKQPLRLNLRGNCLRDIAGCRFTFECSPTESLSHPSDLNAEQDGVVGDMTASRKTRAWTVPIEEALRMKREGKDVPEKMANCLYLEWFSRANGRVVLETVNFRITDISEPEWRMTAEEEGHQQESNVEAMADFMQRLDEAIEQQREQWSPEDDKPMDEFEWERELRESDARTEKYGELLEKYDGHPNAERLVAREMGWDRLDDLLDADERGVFDEEKAAIEEPPPLEPIPETEGVDWIRTEDGRTKHPLAHRAAEASHKIWDKCNSQGLLGEDGDEDIADLTFQAHMLSAKLAGALNGLAYRRVPDQGFVVAYLKRALKFFDMTMTAIHRVLEKQTLDAVLLQEFRKELFQIREEILNLMTRYRGELDTGWE